ncbi:SDR family NAD(P)-dependent oxidoreductase [Pseudobacteriovorax antillogorgiicola]|uniref:Short-chain dehydrogenase n=1 Tax=Pseudobacteriovorax antillogorgiicola TaxID=1513793 RepID=A0A1Y6BIW9_9BACT|nr:SDR family NAD(P)-dependent oxidoreductase [Pseudobacteriovorax antillogorgiicola]TCS56443.1 short-subunit dehydrogenase [Pseudobacteriovorax antillogorgiicola]SMF05396.1 Short-chain dehydrogenase [Pseudobacteriovorax antillogorgiicola]
MTKVAFITGASTGIGHELCLQLADRGYDIGMVARREDLLKELAAKVEAKGRRAVACPCDVVNRDQVQDAVRQVSRELGQIDLLVANAGIGVDQPIQSFDPELAKKIYEVNVIGLMETIAAVLPDMVARRQGHIVGVASLASYISFPKTYVYCASKHAVRAHLDGLRLEAHSFGIKVTTICPGFIKTPLTAKNKFKMPFLMEVDDAVRLMIDGIESGKKVINFPRRLYYLIRIANLLPEALKRRVLSN